MCSSKPHYSGPSAAEVAAQNKAEQERISAQNTAAASAQGSTQNVSAVESAVMMNNQRMRRRIGADSTITGAGEGYSGLGVGTKTGLGM